MDDKSIIIDIEGIDGSGKTSQVALLHKAIKNSIILDYPDYNKKSSTLVKMYLDGEISKDPNDINPYIASMTYALDRSISYLKVWKDLYYQNNKCFISNRYVNSNIIHQMHKLPKNEWIRFINWVNGIEYNKFELPKPDIVIFLCTDVENSFELMDNRRKTESDIYRKKTDIHESNKDFLYHSIECGLYAADKLGWDVVDCILDGKMRKKEDIHNEIIDIITHKHGLDITSF